MKSNALSYGGGQSWRAQFSRTLQLGQNGSSQASSTELCTTGDTSPLFDGGAGDHDLDDFETDTATPDDDEDTVSLASYTHDSV